MAQSFLQTQTSTPSPTRQVITLIMAQSPYTLAVLTKDVYLRVPASSGDFTVNLPAAIGSGFKVSIKRIDGTAHNVVVNGNGGDTFDGGAGPYTMDSPFGELDYEDGSAGNWDL